MLSCQESDGLETNTIHPKPYMLTSHHQFSVFFYDHLKDDFRNPFAMTHADVRCIVKNVESASLQNAVRYFLGAIEDMFSG